MPTVSVVTNDEEISTYKCENGSNLWEALDAQGQKLPHGCLSGSCCACRIIVHQGNHLLAPMGPTEASTVERFLENYKTRSNAIDTQDLTIRLSCQAKILEESPENNEIRIEPF